MKSRAWIVFVALAGLCWGTYVPFVAEGGKDLRSAYGSFLCVGVAYFLIAILFPLGIMSARKKWPAWTAPGIAFATLAGVAGAVGALCVIFSTVEFKGPKIFVAPLIFALAPVINTIFSLFWHPDRGALAFGAPQEKPHPTLYLGIVLAAVGAGLVLFSKEYPHWQHAAATQPASSESPWWIVFVALAGLCWGTYVPLIAQGGKELKNSYGSFLCVGVAYFLIAILFPIGIMAARGHWPAWATPDGTMNRGVSLATMAGVAGAVGALCVIFATFEFKGPKIFVAPLIFALAPVINTIFSLYWHPERGPLAMGSPTEMPHWTLYVGILGAGLGAGLVLFSKEYPEWLHARKKQQAGDSAVPPQAPAPVT
jgi:drug/metabolite transporter (DMT)-like permease